MSWCGLHALAYLVVGRCGVPALTYHQVGRYWVDHGPLITLPEVGMSGGHQATVPPPYLVDGARGGVVSLSHGGDGTVPLCVRVT